MLKARGLDGKDWNSLPAGLVCAASQETHLAATHGINHAEHKGLASAFLTVACVDAKTRFKLHELKSWCSFSPRSSKALLFIEPPRRKVTGSADAQKLA